MEMNLPQPRTLAPLDLQARLKLPECHHIYWNRSGQCESETGTLKMNN